MSDPDATHTVTARYLDTVLSENARLEDQCARFADRLTATELVLARREHQLRILYSAFKSLKKKLALLTGKPVPDAAAAATNAPPLATTTTDLFDCRLPPPPALHGNAAAAAALSRASTWHVEVRRNAPDSLA